MPFLVAPSSCLSRREEEVADSSFESTWTKETQTQMEQWNIGNVRIAAEWAAGKGDGRDMTVIHEQKDLYEEMLSKGAMQ